MQQEICLDFHKCEQENCIKIHPKDKQYEYARAMKKYQIKKQCPEGSHCNNQNICLYLHPGEILCIFCENDHCNRDICILTHIDQIPSISTEALSVQDKMEKSNYIKERGNQFFQEGKYKEALEQYTQAIQLFPRESKFFTNRAVCYKKMKDWKMVFLDAQQAIEIDNNLKARYYKVLAIIETSKDSPNCDIFYQCITELQNISNEEQNNHVPGLQLISQDIRKVQDLIRIKQLYNEHFEENSMYQTLLKIYLQRRIRDCKIIEFLNSRLNSTQPYIQKELSEPYNCIITLEKFRDPVISQAGFTYEKQEIYKHFQQNGATDPFTRSKISQTTIPNKQLQDAILAHNQRIKQLRQLDYSHITFD
ncbi:hypothetical protein pb186bvf_018298 [Paramecium bursaria]